MLYQLEYGSGPGPVFLKHVIGNLGPLSFETRTLSCTIHRIPSTKSCGVRSYEVSVGQIYEAAAADFGQGYFMVCDKGIDQMSAAAVRKHFGPRRYFTHVPE